VVGKPQGRIRRRISVISCFGPQQKYKVEQHPLEEKEEGQREFVWL